ncbi:Golgi Transport [Sorochytrium milnesiophthora]
MFMDKGLLAIGNILFISGISMIIGLSKTIAFFVRPTKLRGSVAFFAGVLMVFIGWPVVGMAVEMFGFVNLFGDFFPVVIAFMRRLPVIGPVLSAPGVSQVIDRLAGNRLPV